MTHQSAAVSKLSPARVGALFMDMGTGKSRTVLELAALRQDKWDKLFWFCPCALRETVLEQVLAHTDIPREDIEVWDGKAMRRRNDGARVHIIGIETMSSSNAAVLRYAAVVTPESYVVVDESSYIKSNRAKRTQRITRMSGHCRYRTILTGTPLTQDITDLFSQMLFLSPKILGHNSWYSFARAHIEYDTKPSRFNPLVKIRTGRILQLFDEDLLAKQIEPYCYQVRREECLDLPEQVFVDRTCRLSNRQQELYDKAKEAALEDFDPETWTDARILKLFGRLQKIVVGFDGSEVSDSSPRIETLLETVGEINEAEPIIIWTKYLGVADAICRVLERHFGADQVHKFTGAVPEAKRNANLAAWRRNGRFLVATQAIGGHGLTLNEAAYSIFFADSFKYSERLQAEGRNHRIGQGRKVVYATIRCEGTIDDRIATSIETKADTLEAFKRLVDRFRKAGDTAAIAGLIKSL
jgi:SNF2 family DNA or RNA helicase